MKKFACTALSVACFVLLLLTPSRRLAAQSVKPDLGGSYQNDNAPEPMSGAWQSHPIGARNYFGVEAGINYAWLNGAQNWFYLGSVNDPTLKATIIMPFANAGHGLGFIVGLVGDYGLSDAASFETKLRYVSSTTSSDDIRTATATDFSGGNQTLLARISSHYKSSWSYAGIDLLLRYQLSPQSVYLLGGLGFSDLVSNTFEGTQSIDSADPNVSYIDQTSNAPSGFKSLSFPSQSLSNVYATTRFDVKIGVGTFIPVGSNGTVLTPEVLLSIPLTDLFNANNLNLYSSAGATAPKLWHLDLTLGIKFPWGEASAAPASISQSSTNTSETPDRNPDNMVVLKGKVSNKAGAPVDANMTVVDLSDNSTVSTGHSSDGNYSLPVKGPGKYSVTADADGYLFGTAYFEVDSQGRILKGKHDIVLSPSSDGRTRLLVFFDFDKDKLQTASYPELDRAVRLMKANPSMSVEIAGYTDSKGTDSYNIDLSNRRAQAVRNYLVRNGIESSRVAPKGYGKMDPIASNDTEEGRAENRRVEFVVLHR